MIEFVRSPECATCAHVTSRLREMTIAHRVVASESADDHHMLREGSRTVTRAELDSYLDEVSAFLHEWRRFQSDACYVEHDGTIC